VQVGTEAQQIKVVPTGVSGLLSVKLGSEIDLNVIMEKLIALEKDDDFFLHCLKIRPIQRALKADLEQIQKIGLELATNQTGKFRITITKRHSQIQRGQIISSLAPNINNPVDLENPDWILLIEILADRAGISVIPQSHIYSTKKAFQIEQTENINWFLE
jgi:tRNA(Ser,Leu) C12 N-acetylase TAN1